MTYTPFDDDDDVYRSELPNQWEQTPLYSPTPSYPDREWTPPVICPSPNPEDIVGQSSPSLDQHPSYQQVFDPALERVDGAWAEQSPNCIHYQIKWRAKLNN
jgi:hypothetical protein